MLRLEIDGRWEPEDFIEVLKGIESLYYKAALRRRLRYEPPSFWFDRPFALARFKDDLDFANDWLLQRARTIAQSDDRLKVSRISYASPGGIDLAGLGEACRSLEGIIDRLIKLITERTLRREADRQAELDTELKRTGLEKEQESLRSLKIENARAILELHRDFHDMPEEMLVALIANDQDRLIPRIAEGKLIGLRSFDGEPPKDDEAAS